MKLYELAATYQELIERVEEGEDIDDAQLVALEDSIEQKGVALAQVIRALRAEGEAIEAEEQRLAQRRASRARNEARLKEYLRTAMQAANIQRIKSPLFTVWLQPTPAKVEVVDPALIPPEYIREKVTREVNKAAIAEAFKADGVCVPGTEITTSTSLRIK